MRKDLRVGLGIGGVLLAVLVVALIVRSNKSPSKETAGADNPAGEVDNGNGAPDNPGTGATAPDPLTTATPAVPVLPPAPASTPPPVTPEPPVAPRPAPGDVFDSPVTPSRTGGTQRAAAGGPKSWDDIQLLSSLSAPVVDSVPPATPPAAGRSSRGGNLAGSPGATTPDPVTGTRGARPATSDWLSNGGPTAPRRAARASSGDAHTHVIQQGETFSSIARVRYGDAKFFGEIVRANPNLNPMTLRPGTPINLPDLPPAIARTAVATTGGRGSGVVVHDRRTQYAVQSGDSLYRIAQKLYDDGMKMDALYAANRDLIGPDRERLKIGMLLKLPEPPTVASAR